MITSAISPLLGGLSDEMGALVEQVRKSLVVVRGHGGSGSGIVWDKDGVIITNNHVVPQDQAEVVLPDGGKATAKVVARDPRNDLATLKAAVSGLQPASIGDSTLLRVGELALAVGNPLGLRGAATVGVVSGVGRRFGPPGRRGRELIQADVDLAPGNSGGPLLDANGGVVGINTMTVARGMALAVPGHVAQAFVSGESRGASLGVRVREVAVSQGVQSFAPFSSGLLFVEVYAGGPADRAGILPGDVLLALNEKPLLGVGDLLDRLAEHQPGGPLLVEVLRGGRRRKAAVTPAPSPKVEG